MGKIKLIVVQCEGFSQNTDWAAAFTSLITGKFFVSHLPALHQAVAALFGAPLCSAFYSKHPGGWLWYPPGTFFFFFFPLNSTLSYKVLDRLTSMQRQRFHGLPSWCVRRETSVLSPDGKQINEWINTCINSATLGSSRLPRTWVCE